MGGSEEDATGAAVAPVVPVAGLGVGFDTGRPEAEEPGGVIWGVERAGSDWVLRFGRPGPDLGAVAPGHRVWVTSDPVVQREGDRAADGPPPTGRVAVSLTVAGSEGAPLEVEAHVVGTAARAQATSDAHLVPASGRGLDMALLADKLGAFGGTPFRLEGLDDSGLAHGLHIPVGALKSLRRELVDALTPQIERPPREVFRDPLVLDELAPTVAARPRSTPPQLVPLCRTDAQLDAAIALGVEEVELDWMEMVGLGNAAARAREAGVRVAVATVRVQKPGEEGFDRRIARLEPEAVLVRHWGALMHFAERLGTREEAGDASRAADDVRRPALHGDFSLNVTNALTARHLLNLGLDTFTVAHDLDAVQLAALLDAVPADRVAVTIHHHIPTFHTEHCVYSHTLSAGRDYRSCGRPCEEHRVSLRDREGLEHPVVVDVGCRNTVFNARAQSAASLVPDLVARGVARLRVEFVSESADEARTVIEAYRALVDGAITPAECVRRVGTHEQFGVSAGTMRTLRPRVGALPEAHRR
jgi:putative protease